MRWAGGFPEHGCLGAGQQMPQFQCLQLHCVLVTANALGHPQVLVTHKCLKDIPDVPCHPQGSVPPVHLLPYPSLVSVPWHSHHIFPLHGCFPYTSPSARSTLPFPSGTPLPMHTWPSFFQPCSSPLHLRTRARTQAHQSTLASLGARPRICCPLLPVLITPFPTNPGHH